LQISKGYNIGTKSGQQILIAPLHCTQLVEIYRFPKKYKYQNTLLYLSHINTLLHNNNLICIYFSVAYLRRGILGSFPPPPETKFWTQYNMYIIIWIYYVYTELYIPPWKIPRYATDTSAVYYLLYCAIGISHGFISLYIHVQ